MPANWIEINKKKIFYVDYRGLKTQDEMIENLKTAAGLLLDSEPHFLFLADFRGATIGYEFQKQSNKLSTTIKKLQPEKAAIIGITGLKKLILNAFNLINKEKVVPFKTKEEAIAYLVS
jgi:hypothetical protein